MIKDSGNRTEFASGAVRDIQEGKGRCDLLPLDMVARVIPTHGRYDEVIKCIANFTDNGDILALFGAIHWFCDLRRWDVPTMLLEVAIHFEEGCAKYGENNWKLGIPVSRYIDSGVRHYLKWLRGDDDERHDRAFCWNMICAGWTIRHKPELNEYARTATPTEVAGQMSMFDDGDLWA